MTGFICYTFLVKLKKNDFILHYILLYIKWKAYMMILQLIIL